jgi:hypothetical protein
VAKPERGIGPIRLVSKSEIQVSPAPQRIATNGKHESHCPGLHVTLVGIARIAFEDTEQVFPGMLFNVFANERAGIRWKITRAYTSKPMRRKVKKQWRNEGDRRVKRRRRWRTPESVSSAAAQARLRYAPSALFMLPPHPESPHLPGKAALAPCEA